MKKFYSESKDPYYLNVSDKHKSFIWSQAKTGSTSFINVFKNLEFQRWDFSRDGVLLRKRNEIQHNHHCKFFVGHENFNLISSARNPYASIYSLFRLHSESNGQAVELIERFFLSKGFSSVGCCYCLNDRIPDYFVRLENLYEDYSKIPFIVNSDLYKSGKLYEMCKVKMNATPGVSENQWKNFYNQNTADLVYYSNVNYFEIVGYHKDSWME